MSKKAFEKISEGLTEVLAISRGDTHPAKLHVPTQIDVRAIREKLHQSQDEFAATFGFSLNQIRDWEQDRSRPIGGVRAYLMLINHEAQAVIKLLRSSSKKKAA